MSRESNLVKNTAILGIGAIFSKGLIFLMIPFFSRWLSVDDYGSFDLFSAYITLLIPFMTLSSGEAIFRFLLDAKQADEQKKIVTNGLLIFATGNTITIALAMLYFFHTTQNVAIPFCCFLFSEALNQFVLTYLRGIKQLTRYTICNMLSMIGITIFVTLLVKVCGLGLSGMLYGYALGYFVSSVFALFTTNFFQYIDFSLINNKKVYSLIQYSAPLIPNAISWWIVNASDRTIIKIFLGTAANGIYAIAYKVPSLCTTLFNVFNVSWQENVVLAMNDNDREVYFKKIFTNMVKILVSICSCILCIDFILFHYIFDIKYFEGMKYAPILVSSCIFTVISQFFGGLFIGLKMPKYNGSTSIMAAVVNILTHLLLVKFVGLYAAAISTIVSFIVLCVVRLAIIKKKFSFSFDKEILLYLAIYLYFLTMHYLDNMIFNWINLAISAVFFVVVNKNYVMKITSKLIKKR